MRNFSIRYLTMLLIILSMCTSCVASPAGEIKDFFESQKEDGYGKVINDSIASIMFKAKSITCELQSQNPADTLRTDTLVSVPTKMHPVVFYLFFNKDNFQSSDTVYGKFETWACFKFEAKKKQTVFLELDFGLKKWRLLDANKKVICAQDMKENSAQFLHFTRLLFPKDLTLRLLNDNLKAVKK